LWISRVYGKGFVVPEPATPLLLGLGFWLYEEKAEQWIKEGKYALKWTRLWRHDFDDNQVRLQLFVMAYNIGNFLRRLALPKPIKDWSLRTMREKLVKIGAKVVSHAGYVIFQMAEVLVSKSQTALAMKALHIAKRLLGGQPLPSQR
jgi:hypothetical protein